jgi:uncharacterized iron-regulated membrane protein
VDASNFAFSLLAVSGLYLWWPRSWRAAARARDSVVPNGAIIAGAKFNWHKVIGVWCAPVLVTLTATANFVSPTTAIVHGRYEIHGPVPSSGQAMLTLVKESNAWLVAGVQLVVKAP